MPVGCVALKDRTTSGISATDLKAFSDCIVLPCTFLNHFPGFFHSLLFPFGMIQFGYVKYLSPDTPKNAAFSQFGG
jgi:hypothetical protein